MVSNINQKTYFHVEIPAQFWARLVFGETPNVNTFRTGLESYRKCTNC